MVDPGDKNNDDTILWTQQPDGFVSSPSKMI